MQIGHALDGADAGTFNEKLERNDGLLYGDRHGAKRVLMRLGIRFFALNAAKSAKTVAMLAKTSAADLTVGADHFGLGFGHRFHTLIIQHTIAVFQPLMLWFGLFFSGGNRPTMDHVLRGGCHRPLESNYGGGGIATTSLLLRCFTASRQHPHWPFPFVAGNKRHCYGRDTTDYGSLRHLPYNYLSVQ
jgi:hypothetical protein